MEPSLYYAATKLLAIDFLNENGRISYSDIVMEFGADIDVAVQICSDLEREGMIKNVSEFAEADLDEPIDVIVPIYASKYREARTAVLDCVNSVLGVTNHAGNNLPLNLILSSSAESQPVNINRGLRMANSKYVVVLDWDVQVTPYWLEYLLSTMKSNRNIGIVGAGLKPNDWYAKQPEGYVGPFPTLAAGCMLIRRIGLYFDEAFPHGWFSDTDFCRQYKVAGYEIWLDRRAKVLHKLLHSTNKEDHITNQALCSAVYYNKWGDMEV